MVGGATAVVTEDLQKEDEDDQYHVLPLYVPTRPPQGVRGRGQEEKRTESPTW